MTMRWSVSAASLIRGGAVALAGVVLVTNLSGARYDAPGNVVAGDQQPHLHAEPEFGPPLERRDLATIVTSVGSSWYRPAWPLT
jgi:hypothetical protein